MGCGASKEAVSAVAAAKSVPANPENGSVTPTHKLSSADSMAKVSNGETTKAPAASSTKQQRQHDWKVRPGYSSGASSYAGSDVEEEDEDGVAAHKRSASRSNMLDLGSLKAEMKETGDIASTVVRIETPFGMPIEQIYEGVQDGAVLGSGVSGIVRLVTHRSTGVKYAVKCLDLGLIDSIEGIKQLRNEIFIMCQLDHPNIVRIEEVYESTNEIYIVQELCHGGDLFDRLDEQPDFHYTEAQCAHLIKQMLSSVRYLHSKGIIHRDLKLENFLFTTQDPDSELKMIDFGLSKHFEFGEAHHDKVGTPYTVAPEIIQGAYDEKCDVWAVGVITYLLLSGETPFGGLDGENLLLVKQNIIRAQITFEPADIWENVSDDGKYFVKHLLQPDPKKRPTAKEVQKDRWIQVWAKKDVNEGKQLNSKTLESLVAFKETSDMQKILSEVLSFTLLSDQMAELRKEFELMDTDGEGEISLSTLRKVLIEHAEAGMLGALTEQEIEDIFASMKTRKDNPTIRWHEFLAAGLSQARVDDRNLKLAFDRLDTNRRGFISFDDLQNLLGNSTEHEELQKIWKDSLLQCTMHVDRISYNDFKRLMKGQLKQDQQKTPSSLQMRSLGSLHSAERSERSERSLMVVTEGEPEQYGTRSTGSLLEGEALQQRYIKKRSRSHEFKTGVVWDDLERSASIAFLPKRPIEEGDKQVKKQTVSPLVANRALYRRHRGMRLAVLEASKRFDKKRNDRQSQDIPLQAGLIMKRGAKPPVELEDAHTRALFESAAKRCGRSRRSRNKTVSDVTEMLVKAS